MADTHTYTLNTYNSDGELISSVSVSCNCPNGADHSADIRP